MLFVYPRIVNLLLIREIPSSCGINWREIPSKYRPVSIIWGQSHRGDRSEMSAYN